MVWRVASLTRHRPLLLPPPLAIACKVIGAVQAHYPYRLGHAIVTSAPLAFRVLWKAVRPFLDPETQARIIILEEGQHEELHRLVDPVWLQPNLGGSALFDQHEWSVMPPKTPGREARSPLDWDAFVRWFSPCAACCPCFSYGDAIRPPQLLPQKFPLGSSGTAWSFVLSPDNGPAKGERFPAGPRRSRPAAARPKPWRWPRQRPRPPPPAPPAPLPVQRRGRGPMALARIPSLMVRLREVGRARFSNCVTMVESWNQ